MMRYVLLFSCALAIALSAIAQTKTSGSIDCNKADPMQVIPIPEREGFAYVIGQYKCTWTKPVAIEGLEAKDFVNTVFNEVIGTSARITATGVAHLGNGDKFFNHSTGTRDMKTMTSSGKWAFTLGTGKLSGIKGGGTYKCEMKSSEPGAGYTCDTEGEYTLPAKK